MHEEDGGARASRPRRTGLAIADLLAVDVYEGHGLGYFWAALSALMAATSSGMTFSQVPMRP